MNETKFTLGPWEWSGDNLDQVYFDGIDLDNSEVLTVEVSGSSWVGEIFTLKCNEYNRDLIETAPELYGRLEALALYIGANVPKCGVRDVILKSTQELLTKARGENK